MCEVTISVPDQMLLALKVEPEELGAALLMAAAMKFYDLGKLSTGAASSLAGVLVPVFLSKLADYGSYAFRLTEEELRADAENA